jgi:glutathione S-transferase
MSLKLIGAGPSPYVRKVRVALAEKGLEYVHDPMVPFGVSAEYKRMHPLGKIPTLVDGDKVVPDSSAILVYLEGIRPEPALYPEDPYARARAVWLEEYADDALVAATAPFFQERFLNRVFFKKDSDEARLEKVARELLPERFDYLEAEIDDLEWLVDGRFTVADIAVASQFVNFFHGQGEIDAERWPKLAAYVERVHARPSFKGLIEEERQLAGRMERG